MRVQISRVRIPERVGVPGDEDFVASCDVANASEWETWGGDEFVFAPEATLTMFAGGAEHSRFVWLARLDGLPVGRVVATLPMREDATDGELAVDVVPVARGRGIGSALLAHGEEFIAAGGRVDVAGYTQHPLAPGAAFELPDDHDSRFLRRHGYRLAQLQVMDELRMPAPLPGLVLRALWQEALAGRGEAYELEQWSGHVPDRLLADYAALRSRMAVDVPHEGLVVDERPWEAARVREHEDRAIERRRPTLVSAARHRGSRELVAYTEILVAEGSSAVEQHDTLVRTAHRGHRLGLWLKLTNLAQLHRAAPHVDRVLTWTAVDNTPMRRINTALGFAPRGLFGNWHKQLEG